MALRPPIPEADRRIYELHAQVCKVLAHPVRLEILDVLRDGPRSPSELADLVGVARANLSQHLAVMRSNGLVRRRRVGRGTVYMVTDTRLFDACSTLRSLLYDQLRAGGELAERAVGTGGPLRENESTQTPTTPEE